MSERSQSDVIGTVLMTLIVTVTVTGAGGVALSEFQSDLGGDPIADIDSELTHDSIAIEHFGGDELNTTETVVQLNGDDVVVPLAAFDGAANQLAGGMRVETDEFESTTGDVSLQVVHKPSQTVVHSETYNIQLLLLVEGETGPVFMVEEPPINYTAADGAELTVSDETIIDVDEEQSTIDGLQTGKTAITANSDETQTVNLTVIEPDQLAIDTLDVETNGVDLEVDGELTALGELDETALYIQYKKQRPVSFNGDPDDAGDNIIADGQFLTGPDGYTHDEGRIRDKAPLIPGENRTYEYLSPPEIYSYVAYISDEDGRIDRDWTDEFPEDGRYNVTVEYTADGSTINVYIPETTDDLSIDVSGSEEVYFTTDENNDGGNIGADSLRLITAYGPGKPQYDQIESGVESPKTYTGEISNLRPDTTYSVAAHTEREITNAVINATDVGFAIKTEGLVTTRDPTDITAESVTLRGNLTNSYGDSDVSFVLTEADGTIVSETEVATDLDTPQEFSLTVDELSPNTEYIYYAHAEDSGIEGDPATHSGENVRFTTRQPAVDTLNATPTGGTTLEVGAELVDLGRLDEMDLSVRYRKQRPVSFNGDPDDAGDNIIADGQFLTGPDGYTHDEGRIRDKAPLVPGENRTYEYLSPPEIYSYIAYISDEDGRIDRDWTDEFPEDGRYDITVEYTDDGSTLNVYIPETTDDLSVDVSGSEEVYFTTDENNGGNNIGTDSLRLITAYGPGAQQSKLISEGVSTPTQFTTEISDLYPETHYYVEAYAEETVNGQLITATDVGLATKTEGLVETRRPTAVTAESVTLRGDLINSAGDTDVSFVLAEADGTVITETEVATGLDTPQEFETTVNELSPDTVYVYYAYAEESGIEGGTATDTSENVSFTTQKPVVDTLNVTATGGTTLDVDEELVDLGGLAEMNLSVRYRKQRPVSFNGDPDDGGDNIIADGQFLTGPDGYTHDEGRIRDKAPLIPGENRTYEYLSPPGIYSYIAYISDKDGRIDRDWTDEFPEDGRYNVTVEYTDDGSTLNVYIPETTDDLSVDVSGSEEVYFTTDENNGGNNIGTDSLRLITAYGPGAQQSKLIRGSVSTPTQFATEISDLYPETHYYVEAYAEETVNGQLITATDVGLATKTEGLVETRRPTAVTAESVTLRGDLINSAGDTDVSFVLAEADGTVVTETEVATGLDTPQEFETTVNELSPDTEYVYYADAEESGIEGGTATDTGENVSFTTQKPVVDTIDVTTTGGTTLDVDGELVDLGGLAEMDLSVRYSKQRPVSFNGDPDDAGDNIIADGQFLTGPDGYTHDEGRIRDKAPLIPGENRTYEYLSPAGIYSYIAYISDEDGGIGRDWTDEFPEDGRYNVTVEYTADGSTINVYIPETTDDLSVDVSGSEEVYFTTDENNGGNNIGTDSLRLITAYGPGAQQSKLISENVRNPTTFSTELSGLQSDTYYYVDTYAEETVNDQLITATDVGLANSTDL